MCMKLPSFRSRSAWRSQRALCASPISLSMTAPALPTAPRLAAILSAKVQGDGTEYTALLRQLSASEPAAAAPASAGLRSWRSRAQLALEASRAPVMGLPDISPECQATLDSWCIERSHCPHAASHGRLHARFDRATMNPASAWRCYAEDTLSPDLRSYSHGHAYCTRQLGLQEIYTECREVSEPTHVQVSSTGASVVLPVPASPPSPSPSPSPLPSPPSSPSKPPELDLTQWEALEPWTHEGALTCPVSYPRGGRRLEPRLRSAR